MPNNSDKNPDNYWGMLSHADNAMPMRAGLSKIPVCFTRGNLSLTSNGSMFAMAWLFTAGEGWRGPGIVETEHGDLLLVVAPTLSLSTKEASTFSKIFADSLLARDFERKQPEAYFQFNEIIDFLSHGETLIHIDKS